MTGECWPLAWWLLPCGSFEYRQNGSRHVVLIVIVPKEGTPTVFITHFLTPTMVKTLQLFKIKEPRSPLLSILIVHLEVEKIRSWG